MPPGNIFTTQEVSARDRPMQFFYDGMDSNGEGEKKFLRKN